MGKVHARCLREASNAEVVGILEKDRIRAESFLRAVDLEKIPIFASLEELNGQIKPDVIDICLPTDLHRSAAEEAFARGYHVFCEKPLALNLSDCQAIIESSVRAQRYLMVGNCLRFWPEYLELKNLIDSKEAGRLLAINLFRRAPRPQYTVGNWVSNPERCVGAALDLHIHDTDMLQFLLGSPSAVSSVGVFFKTGMDHIQTQYHYGNCAVQAEGGWHYPETRPFQMGYSALFEKGSLEFDTLAKDSLQKHTSGESNNFAPLLYTADTKISEDPIAYRRQLEYFATCIEKETPVAINSGIDALKSLRTVFAEILSAKTRKSVSLS